MNGHDRVHSKPGWLLSFDKLRCPIPGNPHRREPFRFMNFLVVLRSLGELSKSKGRSKVLDVISNIELTLATMVMFS